MPNVPIGIKEFKKHENAIIYPQKWFCFSKYSKYFRASSEDFGQTNCGVPLRIERATMLKWHSRHMTSFAEETGDHLLGSVSFTNDFRWL